MSNDLKSIINAIFESRYLKKIERSGTALILGDENKESVVEHSFYVCLIALVMASLNPKLNLEKLLTMCLIHDLEEVRTSDLNLINRIYYNRNTEINSAFHDMWEGSKLGEKLIALHEKRHDNVDPESIASQDCDLLAELLLEKEYLVVYNKKEAEEWMEFTNQRLITEEGKLISKEIINGRMSSWWEKIKNDLRKKQGVTSKDYT